MKKWHGDDPVTDFDLTYDFENRLTSVAGVGYGAYYMNAHYNGDGVRLYKETNADLSKKYVVDGMNTVVEQDGGGSLRYKYVYVNGMLLSKIDSYGSKSYYHRDGLGTIIGLSNNTPEVTTAQLFDDFGQWLYYDSNWGYYGYTGQEYDWPLMDAFNLRAREYYPEYGRFMQEDPIGNSGGSLNWYLYVANNPVNWTDPSGLFTYNTDNEKITGKLKGDALNLANCMEKCIGETFVVTGGSEKIGHSANSKHYTDQAFDMRPTGMVKKKVFCCALECGAGYINNEGNHWHFQTVSGIGNSTGNLPKKEDCECKDVK